MRRLMERKIVGAVSDHLLFRILHNLIFSQTAHSLSAPQTNLHLDILMGRDETIEASDVFLGTLLLMSFMHTHMTDISSLGRESGPAFDVHAEIQKKVRT